MSSNLLTGQIPKDIGLLYNLKNLTLYDNLLEGSIPASITNCTGILVISLSMNYLSGEIPLGLGNLSNLTFLSISANNISGQIPDDLFNCSRLVTVDLSNNKLSGFVKPSIGNLFNLRILKIVNNSFGGEIPPEIGNLTQLLTLSMAENNFSGLIPPEISRLSLLQGLSLHDNALNGTLPDGIFELKQLTNLQLQRNRLMGPIPASFSRLQSLSLLSLSGNMLSGSIPREMKMLVRLMALDLSDNSLTGSIPRSVIGSMKRMQIYLNLSCNSLTGVVPDELGEMEMIQAIDISNNKLSGIIPRTLGGCKNLLSLDISGNRLSGPLAVEAFTGMDFLTSLNLSKNEINGSLPSDLAKMKRLSLLDLSNNHLTGKIPGSFGNFSSLKHLNLSFNHLEGHVPEKGIFVNIDSSSLMGNEALCGIAFLGSCDKKGSKKLSKRTKQILLALGSVGVLFALVLTLLIIKYKPGRKKSEGLENTEPPYASAMNLKRFEQKDLETATEFFSEDNIIGASSLSTVYKGLLEEGKVIAVKKLNLHQFSAESDKCFNREVKILSRLRHRNLVKVIGYAWESRKLKALVLEYMENGNLDSIIHDAQMDGSRWMLSKRIEICISIASGLSYLHSGYGFPIIHCDLKPSNILLDGDWEAHVSDFGTARMLGVHQNGTGMTASSDFQGTIGYMAPEFAYMRKVTTKVDIFSFGTIMLELLTRRRPTALAQENEYPISLHQLAETALANGTNGIFQILDPLLAANISKEQQETIEKLFQLAHQCTSPDPANRPDIDEVLAALLKLKGKAS